MLEPQQRPNLAISTYEHLKSDIIRGTYIPGEKLLMSKLKTRYGVGVGPMREALSQLVAEHLVVAISQRGYRVAPVSIQELNDLYDARAHLEGLIVELAISRGSDDWEAEVIAKAHTLSKVAEIKDAREMLDIWDARHKAFHAAVAAGCASPYLLQARASLFDQAERYRHLWLCETVFSEGALEEKRRQHSAIVEAILRRDAAGTRELMFKHLIGPVPIISEVLSTRGLV